MGTLSRFDVASIQELALTLSNAGANVPKCAAARLLQSCWLSCHRNTRVNGIRRWNTPGLGLVDNTLSPHGGALIERVTSPDPVQTERIHRLPRIAIRDQVARECINIAYGFFSDRKSVV